jgi:uncharacterized protein (DUF58 family)
MAPAGNRFLQPGLLRGMAGMELRVRTVVEGILSGLHRSPYRGLSSEFSEYRQYQLGDELSRLDWKVYARSDRYYIKEFEDETNVNAYIVLDASASMDFGTGPLTKWQYGATIAASLAYLLQRQNDAVALVMLDEAIRVETQSRATRGHLIHLIGEMEKTAPSRGTRLAEVLHRVAAKINRKSLIVVVSDLLDDPPAVIHALRHLQFGGNEVAVFHIADPAELRFEFEGPMRFVEPESRSETLALAGQVKTRYLEAMGAFLNQYREELGKTNIQYALVDTSAPLDRPLYAFLTRGK